ncbi:MAG: hypothetical protein E7317_04820 [Clostridiales bacterium]|nr:hypothetical protein [Clostridiales bacterium]
MRIDTEVLQTVVEIDDREYALAEKTVDVCERLRQAELDMVGKPQHRLWLAELEIVLGKAACRELFPNGRSENVDRLQMIYYGVFKAFNRVNDRLEEERLSDRAQKVEQLFAGANEFLRNLKNVDRAPKSGLKEIRRPAGE